MEQVFYAEGAVSRGYRGTVCYQIPLLHPYQGLTITMEYQKEKPASLAGALREETVRALKEASPDKPVAQADLDEAFAGMKTEINTAAFLNDVFIGGLHSPFTTQVLKFTPGEASEGCIPQKEFSGLLRVNVIVFCALTDPTRYTLRVEAEAQEGQR